MRGGERLVKECSWMRGICSRLYHSTEKSKTFSCRCPSSVMVNNRFRSADYLPCQLPLGGSQETHRRWLFVNYSSGQSSRGRRICRPGTSTLKGRFVLRADSIRPYSLGGEAAAIQQTAQLRTLREAKSLPYRLRSFRFISVSSPGGGGNQRIGKNPAAPL